MRKLMGLSILAVILVALYLSPCALSQETMIWNGTNIAASGITLGSWGSGTATLETKDTKMFLEGNQSIKITSDGLYMGALLDFAKPITLAEGAVDPAKYLVLTMFFTETDYIGPAYMSYNTYDIVPYRVPKTEKMRIVCISDTGVKIPIVVPTNELDPEDNWVRIVVPLAHLRIPEGQTGFNLSRLVIASGSPSTFYLSQIKLVTDSVPFKVENISSQVIALGDTLFFQANVTPRLSPILASWDFGDGTVIKSDPKTRIVYHQFLKGGDFTVSLTVTDALGVKAPVTVSNTISVSD